MVVWSIRKPVVSMFLWIDNANVDFCFRMYCCFCVCYLVVRFYEDMVLSIFIYLVAVYVTQRLLASRLCLPMRMGRSTEGKQKPSMLDNNNSLNNPRWIRRMEAKTRLMVIQNRRK